MDLFVKKSVSSLLDEELKERKQGMKRVLGPLGLIAIGIGAIIGAGLFSVTGIIAAEYTGPAITISFIVAALACSFAGLCYAEFSSMLPIAGSAYTYSYVTMGELVAWIIGWDLVLEYAVGALVVSISWAGYFRMIMADIGINIPVEWSSCPSDGGIMSLPSMGIVILMSLLLIRGTKDSALVNSIIVILKLLIVVLFITIGWKYIRQENLTPFIPANTGTFGQFGISGILRGAAVAFFAYVGFDAVSTAAQETHNPKRNMPIGLLGSLLVCTVFYVLFAYVMTGVANYQSFKGLDSLAPVATAIAQMGTPGADGTITPAYPWLNKAIILAIVCGYTSVILVMLMGQSRVFFSMSRDGLLPRMFSHLHSKYHTPARSNALFMVIVAVLAAFVPARVAGEMVSIGTLFAFTLVCAGVLVMRKTMPDAPRGFKVPLVPYIPVLGIIVCLGMMVFLPADTWLRLVIWMLIGIDVYSSYGITHSKLGNGTQRRHGQTVLNLLGVFLSALCIVVGLWHQMTVGWAESKMLLYISIVFGVGHIFYYLVRFGTVHEPKDQRVN